MADLAPLELKSIGKGLFVRPHEAGQLLSLSQLSLRSPRWASGSRRTFMNSSPSSESIFYAPSLIEGREIPMEPV